MTKLTKKKEIDYQMVPNDSDGSRVTTKWSQITSKLSKMTPKWSLSDSKIVSIDSLLIQNTSPMNQDDLKEIPKNLKWS